MSPGNSSRDGKAASSQPAWAVILGRRIIPLLLAMLLVLVGLRLAGPLTTLWFDEAILWSIGAAGVCLACFSAASVADQIGRQRSQPVGGPLIAVTLRTGGVAVAAAIVAIGVAQQPGRWFLASLACCYVVSLIVDTWLMIRDVKSENRGM